MKFFKKFNTYLNEAAESSTSGEISNVDEMKLQEALNKWNSLYADVFKFQNDEPKSKNDKILDTIIADLKLGDKVINYRPKVKVALEKVAKLLSNDAFKGKEIEVIGHTSSPASSGYNMKLSQRRSEIVIESIKSLMGDKAENVKFTSIGKGENELIVKNDTNSENGIPGRGAKNVDIDISSISDKSIKQSLNRRVELSIKGFEPEYKVAKEEAIQKIDKSANKTVVEDAIPKIPKATEIQFNFDSYILTSSSRNLLNEFAEKIVRYNKNPEIEDNKIIKNIYISSHTNQARGNSDRELEIQNKILYILSVNRAYQVRRILESKGLKDVKFFLYPCSHYIENPDGDEKRVEISFTKDTMSQRIEVAKELGDKYGIDANKGYKGKVLKNKPLRRRILDNLKEEISYNENRNRKNYDKHIPVELWYDEYGSQYEKNASSFRNRIRKIVDKSDDFIEKNFVYKLL